MGTRTRTRQHASTGYEPDGATVPSFCRMLRALTDLCI